MNLEELTQQMHDLVQAKGWYEADSPKQQTPRNLAISLSLEAGEVLEHFQWHENALNQEALEGELADVALYLLQLASVTGIDLEPLSCTRSNKTMHVIGPNISTMRKRHDHCSLWQRQCQTR